MSAFRECTRRAVRTFFQAALGYTAASLAGLIEGGGLTKSTVAGLTSAAVAAGLAAVMNLGPRRTPCNDIKEDFADE